MTSEEKRVALEVLAEAVSRLCQRCKEDALSGTKTLRGAGKKFHHRLANNEIVDCKASPLHSMVLEISQRDTQ